MGNIIKSYVPESGITEWVLPEFSILYKKYPSKYDSIIEIMKNIYYARILVGKGNVTLFLSRIQNLANVEKIKVEEFGMNKEEFNYISHLNAIYLGVN